jgi:adenylate cyclase
MPIEIERRFLVRGNVDVFDADGTHILPGTRPGTHIVQGYLPQRSGWSRRIRVIGDRAVFTVKSRKVGCSRIEHERDIPPDAAWRLLEDRRIGGLVEKTRHIVEHYGFAWEVDVFHGLNAGLIIAEIELVSPYTLIPLPGWVGREITHDPRYGNSALATLPFAYRRHAA